MAIQAIPSEPSPNEEKIPVSNGVKYPDIHVTLVGEDGNAFAILGRVIKALRQGGVPQEEISQFQKEATSGDYDNLLGTCMKWVEVE